MKVIAEPLIAVVDDDAGMRSSLDGLVRSLGYRVVMFGSAEALLGSSELDDARCVISDIQMPNGMDGIALADRLRSLDATRPVILVSAFVDDAVRSKAAMAGAFDVLRKPFIGEALVNCIEQAILGKPGPI